MLFLDQLLEVGFLVHWESLLSTIGDEAGMLEDFIIAIHDANNLVFKVGVKKCGPHICHLSGRGLPDALLQVPKGVSILEGVVASGVI